MEACGSSQYWARKLLEFGHSVRLMDPKRVKPYVRGNKSDSADAEDIFNALFHGERAVAVKGLTERDIHALTTIRSKMVDQRTANINHIRALLAKYGQVIPKSVNQFLKRVDDCINKLEGDTVQLVVDTMRDIVANMRASIGRIDALDKEINRLAMQTARQEPADDPRRRADDYGSYVRAACRPDRISDVSTLCCLPRSGTHALRQRRQDGQQRDSGALQQTSQSVVD